MIENTWLKSALDSLNSGSLCLRNYLNVSCNCAVLFKKNRIKKTDTKMSNIK